MKIFYDLHIHSCLSPCGDNDMTPYNLVNMAKLQGMDMIALTDHNSCSNCESAVKIGQAVGLTVVPGMEICTSEEIHSICLFPDCERAMAFSRLVRELMPDIKNKEHIFGQQLITDTEDNIVAREERLLTLSCSLSIDELWDRVSEYGGVCYPAHIDRSSYSVISALGDFPVLQGVRAFEMTYGASEEEYREKYPILKDKILIRSSDAHYLENMPEAGHSLELKENTPQALIAYLRGE